MRRRGAARAASVPRGGSRRPDAAAAAAAALADTNREAIKGWIRAGRCIGLDRTVRGWRLPRRQFEPAIHRHLPAVARALGTTESWAMLLFLETPHESLDGRSPRTALEQGEAERVIDLAGTEGTGER